MRNLEGDSLEFLKKNSRCSFCGSDEIYEGPSGGMSTNYYCKGCGAGFNISPFDVEVIGEPAHKGCLHVREEKKVGWLGRLTGSWCNWQHITLAR